MKKYCLEIFRDSNYDFTSAIKLVFNKPTIQDVKILNLLKDYTLCKDYEEEFFDKDELLKEGYELYYVEAIIHSGIWLYEFSGSLRDRWDSGVAGIIAIKHNNKDVHFGYKVFKEFLKVWQKVNDGDFYGFAITDNLGNTIDCCSGFYDLDDMRDYLPDCITQSQFEEAKSNIRD